ncbi:MAG: TetR/AcrR family transcriptional regulator [Pseudomonadota bacterium]
MANPTTVAETSEPERGSRRKSDVRQEQLIEIAVRLFAKYGFEGTSLRDIAEEAQITKAALYYHFPNKEALYERIVLESMQALVDTARSTMAQGKTPLDRIRLFMQASADRLDRYRDSWIAGSNAFWSGSEGSPRAGAVDLRDAYEHLLRDAITEAIAAGEVRAVDPAMAGRMLLSMLNHISRWHSVNGRLTTREVIEQYLDMAFNGLRTTR